MGKKFKRKQKCADDQIVVDKIAKLDEKCKKMPDIRSHKGGTVEEASTFLIFDSTDPVVKAFECALLRGDPVILSGTVGCGKSALIDFMVGKFRSIKKNIQISEQTDAKTLLGTYCCTETPGQFVWYPGPLLNSLKEGYWLVLEDVDRGTPELQMLLSPILKRSNHLTNEPEPCQLMHPISGCPVPRHPNFRLIMTRRLVKTHNEELRLEYGNTFADYLDRQSFVLLLPSLMDDEIRLLLTKRFPKIQPYMDRIMNIYNLFTKNYNSTPNSRSRSISLRDLLKFCNRISHDVNMANQAELFFLNAIDCFLCCVSDVMEHWTVVCAIAGELNLTVEKAKQFLFYRSIPLVVNSDDASVQAGRAKVPCLRTADWEVKMSGGIAMGQTADTIIWPFASTRLACTLLERLAVALAHKEPVLLVGETGTGKTSAVQRLANLCGRRLRVINLNQQSDSVDLMGGFKPVDTQAFVRPIREKFESLFTRTFKMETNLTFLGHINTCFNDGRWHDILKLMRHPTRLAIDQSTKSPNEQNRSQTIDLDQWNALWHDLNQFEKRLNAAQKSSHPGLAFTFIEGAVVRALQDGDWVLLDEINLAPAEMLDCLSGLLDSEQGSLILTERGDTQPIRRHPDFHLFAAMNPSTDVGKRELPFGLRNRFTEIYVPELDPGLETPIDASSPLAIQNLINRDDLGILAQCYLVALNPLPQAISTVVRLYSALRQAAFEGLVDGVGQRPHFSLRTLCRALMESGRAHHGSILRSLYEGFLFSFGSQISKSSRPALETLIRRHLCTICDADSKQLGRLLLAPLPIPSTPKMLQDKSTLKKESGPNQNFINVEGYWLPKGPNDPSECAPDTLVDGSYILTSGVRANLKDLARVVAASGGLPVLLQGETSVGKTSLITYLSNRVGQICYRINNHEHTDPQTYLGTYSVASATAATKSQSNSSSESASCPPLVFKEGLLVQAMRLGHWIILDELNLAPTEILESLNRVLDDNRTIFIPETQQTIKAHPHFRLFATQNPPGLYAGRKMLSRALRNRFIELHFDPIPHSELEVILEKRCHLPASRAHRLVEVMHRLQLARCSSNLFQGKDSFITLRDLFRWAERYRLATCDQQDGSTKSSLFDWDAYLADQGYLLLSGRVRNPAELQVVADAIEAVFKRKVTESRLFDLNEHTSPATAEFLKLVLPSKTDEYAQESNVHHNALRLPGFEHIVWTRDMRRLLVLVGNAFKYEEPVLLIGETGCGKTTVCQLFAALQNQKLRCINCHQYTEASDFLGGLRPARHSSNPDSSQVENETRLFEWVDGPLVKAMLNGDLFLLDEISLAEDSVLERLNSLLEPERQIHLAERAEGLCTDEVDTNQLVAAKTFRFAATMNPGGDYGKKELSPALRNRFTEIWCPTPPIGLPTSHTNTVSDSVDLLSDWIAIVKHNLQLQLPIIGRNEVQTRELAKAMIAFVVWYAKYQSSGQIGSSNMFSRRSPPTIRDLIAWVDFIRVMSNKKNYPNNQELNLSSIPVDILKYCLHGAALIFLDALDFGLQNDMVSENSQLVPEIFELLVDKLAQLHHQQTDIKNYLNSVVKSMFHIQPLDSKSSLFHMSSDQRLFGIDPFFIPTGPLTLQIQPTGFSFVAPTTSINLVRLLRAMQLPQRALLLEGSPGVGKTTLVQALARASGHQAIRINLSEATEASDLFGCDLPVEGAGAGVFAWKDGPFLQGLKQGHWIILDEMNLASQSVLECLNACLDHRGEIYIPELGMHFKINPQTTRLFACQNPMREGGGRKGLPKSFLNRFSQVYFHPLTRTDLEFILTQLYTELPHSIIRVMVEFNEQINMEINVHHQFAKEGGPWEFNLRDLMRWCDLLMKGKDTEGLNPGLYVHLLYADRMRTWDDKLAVFSLWFKVCHEFGSSQNSMTYYYPLGRVSMFPNNFQCGLASFQLKSLANSIGSKDLVHLHLMDHQRSMLESLLKVMEMNWMALLVGPSGCGKRTLAQIASILVGQKMTTMYLSPEADTIEFLGALEQREAGGLFAWIDSPLVKGIREGHWVVVENANLCSPSVLDRLNSLLEPNGELILSERGLNNQGELIRLRPHPDFRLILIVDEQPGFSLASSGISRAMRNRGVEITVPTPVSTTQLDLKRLITSFGIDNHLTSLLVSFQNMFVHCCRDSDTNSQHHCDVILQTLTLPIGTKKPSIGAIISGALYLKQLLDEVNPQPKPKKRQLFADDEPNINSLDPTQKAFLVTLRAIYSQRQCSEKTIKAVDDLILQYVKKSFPNPKQMEITELSNPPKFLNHSLTDVRSIHDGKTYRKFHSELIHKTLSNLAADFDASLKFIAQRLLLEQANLDDLAKDDDFQWLRSVPQLDCSELDIPLWTDWADLRWIPGWRRTGMISSKDVEQTMITWNRHLVLLLTNELCQYTVQVQTESKKSIKKSQPTLSSLPNYGVLEAAQLLGCSDLPTAWSASYPELSKIVEQWKQFLCFVASLPLEASNQCLANLYDFVSRARVWLRLFGLKPLGPNVEWADRLTFHNKRVGLTEQDRLDSSADIIAFVKTHLNLPYPLSTPECQLGRSFLSIDWINLGGIVGELLSHVYSKGIDDDFEGDDDDDDDYGNRDRTDDRTIDFGEIKHQAILPLWPMAMVTIKHLTESHFSGQSMLDDPNRLRLIVRSSLVVLTRSNLLNVLAVAQPSLVKDPVQMKKCQQFCLSHGIDAELADLCGMLDVKPSMMLCKSFQNLVDHVNQPNLINEWRSFGQALHTLTWPMLSDYGSSAATKTNNNLTLVGWHQRQQTVRHTFDLLLTISNSVDKTNSTSDWDDLNHALSSHTKLFEQSYQLLLALYKTIGTILLPDGFKASEITQTPLEPVAILNWIQAILLPHVKHAQTCITHWQNLLQLVYELANHLISLTMDSTADLLDTKLGLCWIALGCLYLRCVMPSESLDPCLVFQVECEAVKLEIEVINQELQLRQQVRQMAFGDQVKLWPQNANANQLELPNCFLSTIYTDDDEAMQMVQDHVEAGLEHPWLATLFEHRHKLSKKANDLLSKCGKGSPEVIMMRQTSNQAYSEIRRRLVNFVTSFTEHMLLRASDKRQEDSRYNIPPMHTINRWIQIASDLSNWLTEPHRFNNFADIIQPFLFGMLQILRGLRLLTHNVLTKSLEPKISTGSDLINLLTNSLSFGSQPSVGQIQGNQFNWALSDALNLAVKLSSSTSRLAFKQMVLNSMENLLAIQDIRLRDDSLLGRTGNCSAGEVHQANFRLTSYILDLIWLHCLELPKSVVDPKLGKLSRRSVEHLLVSLIRPLANQWRRYEMERKRNAEQRAALYLEADRRKQQIRNQLQHPKQSGKLPNSDDLLIDPGLDDELDWRLRFSEFGSLTARTELGTNRFNIGLGEEDQIQATVHKLKSVDRWLQTSLNESVTSWFPMDAELAYFVNRLIGLLLSSSRWSKTSMQTGPQDLSSGLNSSSSLWRGHVMVTGYSLASWILLKSGLSLDPSTDFVNLPAYIGLTAHLASHDIRTALSPPTLCDTNQSDSALFKSPSSLRSPRILDVYQDPIPIQEIERLDQVLKNLHNRVTELLAEWPGQPSLVQLLNLTQRLQSFKICDPLMKFITGLEMIFQEIQEWEKNAARHVSLQNQSMEVCNLLIDWRKLELRCWLATLDSAEIRSANRCVNLWFNLHDIFLVPLKSTEKLSQEQLQKEAIQRCDSLVELFEKGPLGEFVHRWHLVASIHSALEFWPGLTSEERSLSLQTVGNIVWFYGQFVPHIQQELANLRRPIEKELKDVVSITKWGDFTRFWAVKTSVDRCKKAIHKQVRAWELVLQKPVRPLFEAAIQIPRPLTNPHMIPFSELSLSTIGPLDLNWLESQISTHPNWPSSLRRLNKLTQRFRQHTETIASRAPIRKWTGQIMGGTKVWKDLVHELSSLTQQLTSTCPPAHLLAQIKSGQKSGRKLKAQSNQGNDDNNDEEDKLNSARQWHYQFTALQQRKRLALSQWLKLASRSGGEGTSTSESMMEFEQEDKTDQPQSPDAFRQNEEQCDIPEVDDLPNLGLSYRRGQRETHTGQMTRFLTLLAGDPWSILKSDDEGDQISSVWDTQPSSEPGSQPSANIKLICQHLARLIALRSSLPKVPGLPDSDPETISRIITELGGPNNLARIMGLIDDLLNQCSKPLASCLNLTCVAKRLQDLVTSFQISLDMSEEVEMTNFDDLNLFEPSGKKLNQIQNSTHQIDQILRNIVHQINFFCKTLDSTTQSNTPVNFEQLFGEETWLWLVHNCGFLANKPRHLVELIRTDLGQFHESALDLLSCTTAMGCARTFLNNVAFKLKCSRLDERVDQVLRMGQKLVDDFKQAGLHPFSTYFEGITQFLNYHSQTIRQAMQNTSSSSSSSNEPCSQDVEFGQLANNVINSMLKSFESLFHADRSSLDESKAGQSELLAKYAENINLLCHDVLSKPEKLFIQLRRQLGQTGSQTIFLDRLHIVRCIYPLMECLSKAVRLRVVQFWNLLSVWFDLGDFTLTVAGRLLTEGFCRPASLASDQESGSDQQQGSSSTSNDETAGNSESGGGTSLTAQGVDTTGAKDVSKELDCQEQIEGLMNDQIEDQIGDDQKKFEDSEGVEMPDDFSGTYEDAPTEEVEMNKDDDAGSDDDEANDLDKKMGDADGPNEELDNEMWASEGEEENEAQSDKRNRDDENPSGGIQDDSEAQGPDDSGDDKQVSTKEPSAKDREEETPKDEQSEPANENKPESEKGKRKQPNFKQMPKDRTTVAGQENQPDQGGIEEGEEESGCNQPEQDGSQPADLSDPVAESQMDDESPKLEDIPSDLPDEPVEMDENDDETVNCTNEPQSTDADPLNEPMDTLDNYETLDSENPESDQENVEVFPYHSGSGDLGNKNDAIGGDGGDHQPNEPNDKMDVETQPDSITNESNPSANTSGQDSQHHNLPNCQDTSAGQFEPQNASGGGRAQLQYGRRQPHGPKPTSQNRLQDIENSQKIERAAEILEADPDKKQTPSDPQSDTQPKSDINQTVQHMTQDMDSGPADTHVYDSANLEQQLRQQEQDSKQSESEMGLESDDATLHDTDERIPTEAPDEHIPSSSTLIQKNQTKQRDPNAQTGPDEFVSSDPSVPLVNTLGAQRPPESQICTRLDAIQIQSVPQMETEDTNMNLDFVPPELSLPEFAEAVRDWLACSQQSAGLARQLCEALRLVLEPTKAARLRGDYRTGKRINMRKIIPYLASHFRKDKIWLRRSQPSQREYRILIAVDDSSSMADNLCRQMTFEALTTVVSALNLLEVGRIGVCSFGETVHVLHDLNEPWTPESGPRALSQFTFKQSKTSLMQLLRCSMQLMSKVAYFGSNNSAQSQLLLILSDGVFSEDPQNAKLQALVRLTRDSKLFPVCLILDDVRKKHSIFDLRRYSGPGKLQPYMDIFPLPYYLVLRDVAALPRLLADALRQWFELEASFDGQ